MWFGVDSGAMRYDGLAWKHFGSDHGLPQGANAFATIGDELYAATKSAIFILRGNRWTKVFPQSSDRVWIFEDLTADSTGNLWSATSWGALRIESPSASSVDRQMTLYAAPPVAQAWHDQPGEKIQTVVVTTPQEFEWSGGSGIYVYGPVPNGQIIVDLAKDSPASQAGLQIGDQIFAINGEDRLTVFQNELNPDAGTKVELKVRRMGVKDPLEFSFTTIAEIPGACQTFRPYRIVEGPDGTIWFATRLGKIISLTQTSGGEPVWQNHSDVHSLPSVAVPSITATDDGIAVVGRSTNTSALIRYDGKQWKTTKLSRGINSSIASIGGGELLVGSNGAVLSVGEQGAKTRPTKEHGIFSNDILVKQSSDNAIWIAGKGDIVLRVEPQHGVWTSYQGVIYQDTEPDGTQWFLSQQMSVVRRKGDSWRQYGIDDGLMNAPQVVLATRSSDIWVAGSHQGIAATAQLHEGEWTMKLHPQLSWSIDRRAAFEDRDGRLWFGGASNRNSDKTLLGGVVRFDGKVWKHFVPTNRLTFVYGIDQTRDGSMWFGGTVLVEIRDDDKFGAMSKVPGKAHGYCDAVAADKEGNLWVGTRNYGLMKMDGQTDAAVPPLWFDQSNGLASNRIRCVLPLLDGTVLASTFNGFSRYDGISWNAALPEADMASDIDYNGLRQSPEGAIWLNSSTLASITAERTQRGPIEIKQPGAFKTRRYLPSSLPPETRIESAISEIPIGDDALFSWTGSDWWSATPPEELMYSWQIDDSDWTPYTTATLARIPNLDSGAHRLQVRSRDRDFNVDPSPALANFHVTPALIQRAWFRALMVFTAAMLTLLVVQTARVYRRELSLRVSNERLLVAEQQLQNANAVLEDRVIARTNELNVSNEKLRREIDERISAQQRANESEIRYRSIVEDQTEYIVRFNAEAMIEFVNAACLRAHDCDSSHHNGTAASHDLPQHVQDRVKKSIENLSAQRPTSSQIVRIEDASGDVGWEEWHGRALFDDQNALLGYQAVGRNITDLKKAEAKLDEKEQQLAHIARVSALGEMVAGISHEINQPLATIANFSAASQVLLEQDPDSPESRRNLREWTDRVAEQAQRISGIIKSLRRFGRPGSELQTFQIADAVAESLLLTKSRIRDVVDDLVTYYPESLPSVTADKIQIVQVLVNLIRNACDAMEEIPRGQRHLHLEADAINGSVVVTVTDSGPGVNPECIDNLFDTFVTTKPEGMGIGLAISRSIVETHQGKLITINDAGCGKFQFSLPVSES